MALLILACGADAHYFCAAHAHDAHLLPAHPARTDLRFLESEARRILPEDPTPSLKEIAARPDVPHLGAPGPAPQQPEEALRVITVGSDAALSCVLTRLMRADHLWAEIGFVPIGRSAVATTWGLPEDPVEALTLAREEEVHPVPLIRSDKGIAVAGSATLSEAADKEYTGEIIVDDATLLYHEAADSTPPLFGHYGARIVPLLDAPGIAAAPLITPLHGRDGRKDIAPDVLYRRWHNPAGRWLTRGAKQPDALVEPDPRAVLRGRAVQTGGVNIRVTIDGVPAPRPVERATFYRHLRDLQAVRPRYA